MISFRLKRTMKLGMKSLWMHRLRSTLTALGIIFGVSSVIAMLAIGEGASRDAQERIAQLGSRNIIIKTVDPPEDSSAVQQQMLKEYGLTYRDAERFRNAIPDVRVIVPNRRISHQALYRNKRASVEVIGTVPWYPEISPVSVQRGRFLCSTDMHYKQGVCVVDNRVAREMFGFDDPLAQYVKIAGDYYRVVGVATEQTTTPGVRAFNTEDGGAPRNGAGANTGAIYIPLTTVKDRFGEMSIQITSGSESIEKVELQEMMILLLEVLEEM